jgi:hypothetical protein
MDKCIFGVDNMDYVIRLATEKDCNELARVKHNCWETTYRGIYSDEKIDNFDYDNSILSSGSSSIDSIVFIYCIDGYSFGWI